MVESGLVANGGGDDRPHPSDLTQFQIDCLRVLEALEAHERRTEPPHGLAIKAGLEDYYGDEVGHGRLYPNLDTLVGEDLVTKSELDKRTNGYQLTDAAVALLDDRVSWLGGER